MMRPGRWPVCVLALALAACGTAPPRDSPSADAPKPGGYYKDDGPGETTPANLAEVADAMPVSEPLSRFANRPYEVFGREYVPFTEVRPFEQRGIASWYGRKFHGQKTSSGERYDMYAMTAAHPTLPIPSYARVTNLQNGRSVVVRINDRGPFLRDRVIDLSYAGAWKLGYVQTGQAQVEVRAIVPGESSAAAAAPPAASAESTRLRTGPGPVSPESAPGSVYLQLAAFAAEASAESMRERLQRQLDWIGERIEVLASGALYKLQLGPYRSREDAIGIADRIAQELNFRPFVVVR